MIGSNNDGVLPPELILGTDDYDNPLVNNYGDQFRGDINVDSLGNIYVGSSTTSRYSPSFVVCSNNEIINQPVRMARSNRSCHFCFYLYFIVDISLNS